MSNKKNIDRLFQEKFKDFETFPEKDLWPGIEARLDKMPNRRKPLAMWWKLGGVAAAIILLLSLGLNGLFDSPTDIPEDSVEKIGTVQQNETDQDKEIQLETQDNTVVTEQTHDHASQQDNTVIAEVKTYDHTSQRENTNQQLETHGNTATQDDTAIAVAKNEANQQVKPQDDTAMAVVKTYDHTSQRENTNQQLVETSGNAATKNEEEEASKKSLLAAVAEMEQEEFENSKDRNPSQKSDKKWSLSPNIAPVYYNSVSGGSPIDPEFAGNSKSGNVNISYGINVAYEVNNRLSLRTGINRVNYGYNTNDIAFSPNFEAKALSNVNYARQSDVASAPLVSNSNGSKAPPLSARNEVATFTPQEGNMQQEFGYIEVPMEIKYRIVDQRFGLNVIGGISSLFLTDNSILLKSDNLATKLGEANNINEVNFSTNVGLGVDYLLSDKLRLQVEPMFKYQLNTFSSDNGGFRPYSFGVYTGFSFRF